VPQQPAKPGLRAAEALGLTIFLATAALLTALLITWVGRGFGSLHSVALILSTLCAMVASFAMLWDAFDLWVRGRRMTPYSVKMLRSLVFVAVLAALGASMLGANVMVVIYLAPAMITYLFIARRPPAPARARGGSGASSGSRGTGGAASGSSGSAARARQRRGGKKRR
jgi:hypothetical protein